MCSEVDRPTLLVRVIPNMRSESTLVMPGSGGGMCSGGARVFAAGANVCVAAPPHPVAYLEI